MKAGAKPKTTEALPTGSRFRKSEASRVLQVSRPTIDKMIQDGRLQVEIIGGVKFVKTPE